jgi:hypothetical protein
VQIGHTGRMPVDMPPGRQVFRSLESPLPPTVSQLRLLSWLTTGAGAPLSAQVAHALVTGECVCGCSSVQLASSAAPLPPEVIRRLSGNDRHDYISLTSTGRSSAGRRVDVVLHVVEGRVAELEIFDSEAGEGTAVDLDSLRALDPVEVD